MHSHMSAFWSPFCLCRFIPKQLSMTDKIPPMIGKLRLRESLKLQGDWICIKGYAPKGVEKREPSYIVGGNVSWCSHYGKHYGDSLKKLKIELLYDAAIPLLGIYLKKTLIQKDTCTPMFIAVLFTITRTWKQPKCPSTEEWIKNMWYLYTMEYYSAIKRMK